MDGDIDFGVRSLLHLIYSYMFWFENELFEVFDVKPKDIKKKERFWTFNKKNIIGSIVKVEDFDSSLNVALKEIVDENLLGKIQNKNIADNKPNVEYYVHLKEFAEIPSQVVGMLKKSFSYQYFYES